MLTNQNTGDFTNHDLKRKAGCVRIRATNWNFFGGEIMNRWLYFGVLIVAIGMVIYLLYSKGLAVIKSIAAILFVFRTGRDADKATLDSCTGWVKHVGRFQESRTYEFAFDAQLSKGNVEVILLDNKKQQLLKLNQRFPTGKIELDTKNRYYLYWNFKSATGKCELHW